MQRFLILMAILAVVGSGITSADAESLLVSLDRDSYWYGDEVSISGVCDGPTDEVRLTIYNPLNNVISVSRIDVEENGQFESSLTASGYYWGQSGSYTARVSCAEETHTMDFKLQHPSDESERTTPEHEAQLTADLDRNSYRHGETVNISGVCDYPWSTVYVQAYSSSGHLMKTKQVKGGSDGQFDLDLATDGSNWNYPERYTVKAICAGETHTMDFKLRAPIPTIIPEQDRSVRPQINTPDAAPTFEIMPERIKDVIMSWAGGNTTDSELIKSLGYLMELNIIKANQRDVVIAEFVDPDEKPQYYIERYNNELEYRVWFDTNYPDLTIYEAVGIHDSATRMLYDENVKLKEELRKSRGDKSVRSDFGNPTRPDESTPNTPAYAITDKKEYTLGDVIKVSGKFTFEPYSGLDGDELEVKDHLYFSLYHYDDDLIGSGSTRTNVDVFYCWEGKVNNAWAKAGQRSGCSVNDDGIFEYDGFEITNYHKAGTYDVKFRYISNDKTIDVVRTEPFIITEPPITR